MPIQHIAEQQDGPLTGREQLKPGRLGPGCRDREQRIGFGSKPHRQRTRLAFLKRIEADIGRDLIEPGPQRGLTLEGVAVLPGAQHRLLHQILGIMPGPQQAITVQVQFLAIWLDEGAEFGNVASSGIGLCGFRCHNSSSISPVQACAQCKWYSRWCRTPTGAMNVASAISYATHRTLLPSIVVY